LIREAFTDIAPENLEEAFDSFASYGQEGNPEAEKLVKLIEDYKKRVANPASKSNKKEEVVAPE
jgi:hypothetical protein